MRKIRIGIDVGGTFTHAVAVDASTRDLIAKSKVPTTHTSGVGRGIVQSLDVLLKEYDIQKEEIILVAHSTTQATNSLLEGDVEPVAIISCGRGFQGRLVRLATSLGGIKISAGKFLKTFSHFVDLATTQEVQQEALDKFLTQMKKQGVRVAVVSAPFSNEWSDQEKALSEYVRSHGFWVTPTHEVCELYGMKIRTRTAAINASILPKMIETAETASDQIRAMGITAPFMIMRSDGGIMSIEEMRKKPIMTLLSGPAAGIAAALRYLKISDGIFLEVGGTSTDISVIKNGRALTRTAVIGGSKTFLRTLDCRTLGIGGGSLPRLRSKRVHEAGPRSAHIAGLHYACFSPRPDMAIKESEWIQIQPITQDPKDYLALELPDGERLAFTPTCASNILGLVPSGDCAEATLPLFLQRTAPSKYIKLAEQVLDASAEKLIPTVLQMLKQYKMNPAWTVMVGGGGGASALIPYIAQRLGMRFEIAKNNDVISAIGVAMGMVREVIEKSIINPTPEDLSKVRFEARARVIEQGAQPESVEVFLEVDTRKNIVRAEAQGTISYGPERRLEKTETTGVPVPLESARMALGLTVAPEFIGEARASMLTASTYKVKGPRRRQETLTMVTDPQGVVRLKAKNAVTEVVSMDRCSGKLAQLLESHAIYSDGGVEYPLVTVLASDRILDLSKLSEPSQIIPVLDLELRELNQTQGVSLSEPCVILMTRESLEEESA